MNRTILSIRIAKYVFSIMMASTFGGSAMAGTILKLQSGSFNGQEMQSQALQMFTVENSAGDYIVQFENTVTEKLKSQLRAAGVQTFRYLPEDALIVRAKAEQLESLREKLQINAIVPYKGMFKLAANIPTLSVFSQMQREVLILSAFKNDDLVSILAQVQKIDPQARVLLTQDRTIMLQAALAKVAQFSSIAGVEFVQKAEEITPLAMDLGENLGAAVTAPGDYSDLNGYETGTKVMNFDVAWSQGYRGQGQIVSMADTGLDTGSLSTVAADFKGAIHGNGHIFGVGAKDWSDSMGHGTHVAGSVMGHGVTSSGKIRGGAYEAEMVPQGMWSPIIDNLTVPPQLATMFQKAYADGARIHTNSWGAAANPGAYDAMAQRVDEFMFNNPDMLVLFAAGNSGIDKNKDGVIDPGSIATPGTSKNVLTVGASENLVSSGGIQRPVKELRDAANSWGAEPIWSSKVSDNVDGIAMFSSRGPAKDGRLKPEIVAPGTNILSNMSQVKDASPLWGAYNSFYAWSGGTSMATPLTAGAATVVREMLIKKHNIATPSAALIKAALMHTAYNMYPGQYGTGAAQEIKSHPDSNQGYGRVDMAKFSGVTSATTFVDEAAGVATGATFERRVTVPAGGQLTVNLVYTDAPGSPSAGAALVNDLDLVVMDASGKVLSRSDSVNNNEYFDQTGLDAGTYVVQVKGKNVPMGKGGKQPFALVYTAL